ncbi:MAG: hypothetical protein LBO74_17670 [Candidatus Symbiothrix sp.]|jgi:hypothetical protein|nr:hypothetical protein [Candidatus Symbiothrix sp.]
MKILDMEEMAVAMLEQSMTEIEKLQFEKDWKNSISGEEFVLRVHKHIDEWYAAQESK